MRAVIARAGALDVITMDDPVPGPGQVLVAPIACGICGSDLHLLQAQSTMPDLLPPMVLGHEFVGEILDYGPETARALPPGTVVTSVPYLDRPEGPQLIGLSPTATGGLAERMVLQESRLLAVPGDVPAAHAALVEPLSVGAHAVAAADIQPGDVTLVIGCGPVGLAVIAALRTAGHGPIVASDFSAARRSLAELVGADVVVDPATTSPYTAWSDLAGPALPSSPLITTDRRANTVAFECVGLPGVLDTVVNSVLPHTPIVVVGVCTQPDTIHPAVAITKEISIRFVFAYRPDEFARVLGWIADGVVDPSVFVTATLGFDDAAHAVELLAPPTEHCKILLSPATT